MALVIPDGLASDNIVGPLTPGIEMPVQHFGAGYRSSIVIPERLAHFLETYRDPCDAASNNTRCARP